MEAKSLENESSTLFHTNQNFQQSGKNETGKNSGKGRRHCPRAEGSCSEVWPVRRPKGEKRGTKKKKRNKKKKKKKKKTDNVTKQ